MKMDEEKKESNVVKETKESPPKDSGDRDKSPADIEIERVNADTERIEKAIADNANAKARLKLGGDTEAGQPTIEVSEDQKKIDDAVEYFKDTQLGIDIKKANE